MASSSLNATDGSQKTGQKSAVCLDGDASPHFQRDEKDHRTDNNQTNKKATAEIAKNNDAWATSTVQNFYLTTKQNNKAKSSWTEYSFMSKIFQMTSMINFGDIV